MKNNSPEVVNSLIDKIEGEKLIKKSSKRQACL